MNEDVKMFIAGSITLIALFIIVSNGSNFGQVTSQIAQGTSGIITSLQGRSSGSLSVAA